MDPAMTKRPDRVTASWSRAIFSSREYITEKGFGVSLRQMNSSMSRKAKPSLWAVYLPKAVFPAPEGPRIMMPSSMAQPSNSGVER